MCHCCHLRFCCSPCYFWSHLRLGDARRCDVVALLRCDAVTQDAGTLALAP